MAALVGAGLLSCCLLRQPASFTAQPTNEQFQDPFYYYFFSVPDGFELTDPKIRAKDGHGWLINPLPENFPIYVPFVSILPAMLFYVLLFVTTEVSE